MIVVESVSKTYGRLGRRTIALDGVSLQVRRGETLGLIGPNGAGKTTLLSCLLGFLRPDFGAISIDACPVDDLRIRARTGYMPERLGFDRDLSGADFLAFHWRLSGGEAARTAAEVSAAADRVGLERTALRKKLKTYSRGMLQRLGIADALVKSPEILILDEPTISIDPIGVAELLELIRGLVREHGLTVLLSSHLLEQVQHICDRVGIFCAGRLMASGTVSELLGAPADGRVSLEVGVEGDVATALEAIRGVDGVTAVEPDPDQPGVLVVDGQRDVRNEVVAELTRHGLPISHLVLRRAGLESVYRRYIEECQQRDERANGQRERAA